MKLKPLHCDRVCVHICIYIGVIKGNKGIHHMRN